MERMDFSYWIRHILCIYRFNATLITSCGLIQPHHQPVDYPALTSKVASYVKATSPQTWRKISRNFAQTPIKRFEPRDKAYYNDKLLDHACPMTIRWFQKSLSLGIVKSKFLTVISSEFRGGTGQLRHRIPDVIGIGFAKCGTGALAFLDCHPDITFRTPSNNELWYICSIVGRTGSDLNEKTTPKCTVFSILPDLELLSRVSSQR